MHGIFLILMSLFILHDHTIMIIIIVDTLPKHYYHQQRNSTNGVYIFTVPRWLYFRSSIYTIQYSISYIQHVESYIFQVCSSQNLLSDSPSTQKLTLPHS